MRRRERRVPVQELAVDGTVLVSAASVSFEEILDARVTTQDVGEM